jgi:C4-dicarboxylate transporter
MTRNAVRATLACSVVGVFLTITAVMALFPLFSSSNVPLSDYADFFAKMANAYTGIVGVIVGYYFARSEERRSESKEVPAPTSDKT